MAFYLPGGDRVHSYLRREHKTGDLVAVYINGDPDLVHLAKISSIVHARTSGHMVSLASVEPDAFTFTQHMHYNSESFEFYLPFTPTQRKEEKLSLGLGVSATNSDMQAKKEALYDPQVAFNIEFTKEGIKTRTSFHRRRVVT